MPIGKLLEKKGVKYGKKVEHKDGRCLIEVVFPPDLLKLEKINSFFRDQEKKQKMVIYNELINFLYICRDRDCDFYGYCLDDAIKMQAFSCESCALFRCNNHNIEPLNNYD